MDHVKRMHFSGLQHNKILIAKRDGQPFRVLTGSTNFSLRGMCIQANNLLDFNSEDVAGLYAELFDAYWTDPKKFRGSSIEAAWHDVQDPSGIDYSFCFSPHFDANLSLGAVAQAIGGAQRSVLFAVAFLYNSSGLVRNAIDAAVQNPAMFTYGISDKKAQWQPQHRLLQRIRGCCAAAVPTGVDGRLGDLDASQVRRLRFKRFEAGALHRLFKSLAVRGSEQRRQSDSHYESPHRGVVCDRTRQAVRPLRVPGIGIGQRRRSEDAQAPAHGQRQAMV